ncbi:hypothetical protein U14_00502 [Candidatus Moduliflexus flocculans]|uniref:DUF4129 domain-containing protein n=1 Tax=Candidatus Moduliflexus flocculans TaxID=1499966 RepID=A0A0S6VVH3_9BACT|nr:hypothetical protein U14_00502 [Candidatus Moduliflexus flocculans]
MATHPLKKPIRPKIARHRTEKGAIDLVEEAFHLLRRSSLATLAHYYIGSLPFVLALLYFWTDMSRSAYAAERCAEVAFGLTVAFLWMKSWQAAFALRLKVSLQRIPFPAWTWQRVWRLIAVQTIIQSWGMIALPCSLVLGAPFPWLYAFYQNATAFGGEEDGSVKSVTKRAWNEAKRWPKQNMLLIWLTSPWLLVSGVAVLLVLSAFFPTNRIEWTWLLIMFLAYIAVLMLVVANPLGGIVAANLGVALYSLPQLLKMFFGVETMFTRGGMQMFNSTFFAVVCGLTYLCLDPLIKAAYVARCFYGEALRTGEDLTVEIRSLALSRQAATLLLALTLPFMYTVSAFAQTPSSENVAPAAISPSELNQSLDHVMNQPEYAWRMARERKPNEKEANFGFFTRMFETFQRWGKTLKIWLEKIGKWFGKLQKWINKIFPKKSLDDVTFGSSGSSITGIQLLLYLLLGIIACVAAIMLWRVWRKRRQFRTSVAAISEANAAEPDLSDENVDASQFPADSWLTLAQEMIERGDFRLALRAFYLAGLAYLGEQHFVALAKYKSDREYEKELRRRAHAFPALLPIFTENMLAYQRSWYGLRDVERATLDQAMTNYEQLKRVAAETE